MTTNPITPVILSGGSGTRLWPLSRLERPKQMLALAGVRTMIQETAGRVADAAAFERPVVVTGIGHAGMIEAQLEEIGIAAAEIIVEPSARNTAPAIALAALRVSPDALLLVMPSDHVIGDTAEFEAAVRAAAAFAATGWLCTFGITASSPEIGYGYIRRGESLGDRVFAVDRFVEKPDLETAQRYLDEGCYDWNGGIFLFRADAYLAALATLAPDIISAAAAAVREGTSDGTRFNPQAAAFAQSPSISIDNAVLEKADKVAVVPVDMQWSDVGSFDALYELRAKEEFGNAHAGDVVSIGSERCLVHSEGQLVVTVGVSDLVIISTPDAVLVMPRGDSQRVKEAVAEIKRRDHRAQ